MITKANQVSPTESTGGKGQQYDQHSPQYGRQGSLRRRAQIAALTRFAERAPLLPCEPSGVDHPV